MTRINNGSISAGSILAYILRISLCVVLPVFVVIGTSDAHRSAGWIPLIGVVFWSGWRLSQLVKAGDPELGNFFFYLYVYVFMGIAPMVQIRLNRLSGTTYGVSPSLDSQIAAYVIAGIVAYEVGRKACLLLGNRSRTANPGFDPAMVERKDRSRSAGTDIAGLALIWIGLVFSAVFVSRIGLTALFASRDDVRVVSEAAYGTSAELGLVKAMGWVPLSIGLCALGYDKGASKSILYKISFMVGIAVLVITMNPIGNSRYMSATALFVCAASLGILRSRRRVQITLIGLVIAVFALFPQADRFRTSGGFAQSAGFFEEYASNNDYDGFWQIGNALDYVGQFGSTHGRQLLGAVFAVVPRQLWPSKPLNTGELLADASGYSYTNLSAPLWAEGIVNFGVMLGLVFMIFCGALVALVDRNAARRVDGTATSESFALTAFVGPYMMILARGSLLQACVPLTFAIFCFLGVRVARRLGNRERLGDSIIYLGEH